MKMKSFGKCLKMDLQSVGGEVSAAYMTLLLFTFFGANPLLVPSRIYMADYSFAIPAAAIIFYCFFRIFKRLLYIAMFTDGAILYRFLRRVPQSQKSPQQGEPSRYCNIFCLPCNGMCCIAD